MLACQVLENVYIVVASRLCSETEVSLCCKQSLAVFDPVLWKISCSLGSES